MLQKIKLSCFKATELVEKSILVDLNAIEKFRLKLHLSICDACKKFEEQSKVIDKALAKQANDLINDRDVEELKNKIKGNIV